MAIKLRFIGLVALLFLLIAAGCSRLDDTPESERPEQPTAANTSVAATPSPEPMVTATPTPEPTPISPGVVIGDQRLDESGVLLADRVTLPEPGWLAIYRAVDGEPDEIIGRQPLAAGMHENVEVTVDPHEATELLFAGLHMDAGAEGVFDYPGEDEPYPGEPEAEFVVELLLPQPQVEVAEQTVAEDGVVTLSRVELLEPSWVLIHAEDDGGVGPVVGGVLLDTGIHENVAMTIDWRRASPTLYAVLHEDVDEVGVLDYPDGDMPILQRGEPIVAAFKAMYPPEVLIYDQPIIDSTVTIERVISNGPGWVVINNEADGQPGFIIGTAPLEDGLNEQVTVELLEPAITTQLFARLHQDTEPIDEFNFPGQDLPVLFNNRMPRAASFRTDMGAHAFVRDQRVSDEDTLNAAVVVSPVPAWVAVYGDDEGQPGDLLGQTWVPAGISRDVIVEIDPDFDNGIAHLVLYEDLGEPEEFEAPGVDVVLTNNDNRPIHIPFTVRPVNGR